MVLIHVWSQPQALQIRLRNWSFIKQLSYVPYVKLYLPLHLVQLANLCGLKLSA